MATKSALKKSTQKKAQSPIELGIRQEECRISGFYVVPPDGGLPESASLSFATQLVLSTEPDAEKATMMVTMTGSLGDTEEKLISIQTINQFKVTNLSKLERDDVGDVIAPGWLTVTIIAVSVGMTKGVLYQKLSGTIFDGFIVPIISLHDLLPSGIGDDFPSHGV